MKNIYLFVAILFSITCLAAVTTDSDITGITASGFTNPMTTGGDLIYGGASGAATRLANGTVGKVLTSAGTTLPPTWETPSSFASGAFTSDIIPSTNEERSLGSTTNRMLNLWTYSVQGGSSLLLNAGADITSNDLHIMNVGVNFYYTPQGYGITMKAPTSIGASYNFFLPPDDGAANQYMKTDGAGNTSWAGSPQGTVCGWYDVTGTALIVSCLGSDPNSACPTGYTQKTTTGAKFCSAN